MNQITKYLSLFFKANLNCYSEKDLAIKPVHENEIPELKSLLSGIYCTGNSIQKDFLYGCSLNF
ncbi:hypothetical protein JN11_01996 [Mucilaginibacter frigoritolerans]|jgi:hypothetical protein|uniref:Uncharacterized protein n=1 Tax=Mucilaginibacter frigoritolerans TaxID=652788 RepID=A0A562U4L4_9SPHI|nr:hypothetical protein JN11_01996 [Mucilaginibacter frigoritolerans]